MSSTTTPGSNNIDNDVVVINDNAAAGFAPTPQGDAVTVTVTVGPCSLGAACSAKDQELSVHHRCSICHKQLHGFSSGCSIAKNPMDFRDGVICKEQPCGSTIIHETDPSGQIVDGAAHAAAAGLPEFLWETQQPKRKRDPNAPKQRRQRYTKEQKIAILETLNTTPGSKLPDIAKQFHIPEGTLRGWFDDDRRQKSAVETTTMTHTPTEMGEIGEHILDPSIEDGIVGTTPPIDKGDDAPEVLEDENPRKRRRQRYSNEIKIQVILALETRPNASLNEVAKEFQVAPGTVRGWREEADKIQKQAMENRRVGAKANPSRDPLKRIWDAILSLFEKNSRLPQQQRLEVNVAVVRTIGSQARDVLLKANSTSEEPFLSPTEVLSMQKFKASETWARKWARDHQVISTKPETGTQIDTALARLTSLQKVVAEFSPDRVYTMTSTALFYRILPHRTYVSKPAEAVIGTTNGEGRVRACKGLKSKDRLTLYICANESGMDKLPITCIGKYGNPACFQVAAQKNLPYLNQEQALSDAGTYQQWWRTVFLPHVRSNLEDHEKCLLLVDDMGPCVAELLKDPTGQVIVEALPPSQSSTLAMPAREESASQKPSLREQNQAPSLPQCQAFEYGIIETIKRRYRYRLLQEVMDAFDERAMRRKVADNASFPKKWRGLREGSLGNVADGMRLLESIWNEVATTTIAKAWQRTKLRPKSKDEIPTLPHGQRAKSEKRQTTREKKQLVKDLVTFLSKHESKDFSKDDGAGDLEEMIEKLKNCFLYTDGEIIESKEMVESIEEWIGLEDSQGMVSLFMEEIKAEMNIEYLVGLKAPIERAVPEADEDEDPQADPPLADAHDGKSSGKNHPGRELDLETAMELASTIKSTACKLFGHGDILGELAVRLDDASDSVFRLLRKQKETEASRQEAEKAKAYAKSKAKARAAADDDVADEAGTSTELLAPSSTDVNTDIGDVELPDELVVEGV